MLLNCNYCFRCCIHFTKLWMSPYLNKDEAVLFQNLASQILGEGQYVVQAEMEGQEYTVINTKLTYRCPLWSFDSEKHCQIYEQRPLDCRLYPFLLKDGKMIIHLTCPDAVRMLQLLDAGDLEAENFYKQAKKIIAEASEDYLRYLEWNTKDFRFYCVIK